ncbi:MULTISPECIES: DUF4296 domain-containing protein [Niastella]|uniref:DUF4296 domain-containing protein n=1 Tax=Niastella soli TaxID=2821487 RepID=A0ABS3YUC4_9BACT|nr:DUF4296 domain-containing protein [Niastella soli]MBO9201444.1 DUF4296 domain-containing protein [Niastella soli]
MSRLLLVCLSAIVCCLVSCTDKDKIPKGVMGKEKMQKVMLDMIQAERFREGFIQDSAKDLKVETFKLYAQVFELNKITKDEFIKSYKFYMSRPDIARQIFDSMANQANRLRENLYKPKALDTAAKSKTDTFSADSAKAAAADSAKSKGITTDSAKKVITPAPVPSTIAPATMNARRDAFRKRRLKDTMLRYNKTKP